MNDGKEQEIQDKEADKLQLEKTKINFKNGITVYEGKMAVLIFGAMLTLLFTLTMYYLRLDISNNLTSLAETFILCIAGITTAETAVTMLKDRGIFKK